MRRPLWTVLAGLLGAAAALWGSSRLAWTTEVRTHPGTDAATVVDRVGADIVPLVPLAVLALAGIAATVAIGGWPRRLVGVLLAAAGVLAVVFGLVNGWPKFFPWGQVLAIAGGLLQLVAGTLLVWFSHRLPRMGESYQRANTERRLDDPDHEMWRSLSLGKDPTTDEP